MIGFLFSGQGSQKPGMADGICAASPAAARIFEKASRHTGIDLRQLDAEMLQRSNYAQLAIVSTSLAAWASWRERSESSGCFAGFSLGEYSALAAAGVLELETLLDLVQERARLMQEAAERQPGAMYAILGPDAAAVEQLLVSPPFADKVFAVNFNCPGQTVISGLAEPAAAAADALKAAGARRCLQLNVAGAFHTRFMEPAAQALTDYAQKLDFKPAQGPMYSNSSGQMLLSDTNWPDYLAQHLCQPVHWTREVSRMVEDGYSRFLEFGYGKVLCGLVKKIDRELDIRPVEDTETLAAACS